MMNLSVDMPEVVDGVRDCLVDLELHLCIRSCHILRVGGMERIHNHLG
jgi:hypothetical protein